MLLALALTFTIFLFCVWRFLWNSLEKIHKNTRKNHQQKDCDKYQPWSVHNCSSLSFLLFIKNNISLLVYHTTPLSCYNHIMYILHVIPIARGIHTETVAYFSMKEVSPGEFVRVPYNNRILVALVVKTQMLRDLKADIKATHFSLKNIIDVLQNFQLPEACIRAGYTYAEEHHMPAHTILSQIIPPNFIAFLEKQSEKSLYLATQEKKEESLSSRREDNKKNNSYHEIKKVNSVLQLLKHERYEKYRIMARANLSQHRSLLIVAPSTYEVKNIASIVQKGIKEKIYTLHGALTPARQRSMWKSFASVESPHAYVVITTPHFLASCIEAPMILEYGMCIIESPSSSTYISTHKEPAINMLHYIERAMEYSNIPILYGDTLLPLNILYKTWKHVYEEEETLQFRTISSQTKITFGGRETPTSNTDAKKPWAIFTEKGKDFLARAIEKNGKIVIFAPRTGLASATVCKDCWHTVSCPNCNVPLVLMKDTKMDTQEYQCHYCMMKTRTGDVCSICHGHRLLLFGVTTQKISDEINNLFPDTQCTIIDCRHMKTEKELLETLTKWKSNTKSHILIGTSMMIPYLDNIQYLYIPTLESFMARTEYDADEKLVRFIMTLTQITTEHAYINMRSTDNKIIQALSSQKIQPFLQYELELRNKFNYPPFTIYYAMQLNSVRDIGSASKLIQPYLSIISSYHPHITLIKKGTDYLRPGVYLMLRIPVNEPFPYTLFEKISYSLFIIS